MSELKPCPFCEEQLDFDPDFIVRCPKCGMESGEFTEAEELIAWANTRPIEADLERRLAEAEWRLKEIDAALDVEEINPCNYDHDLVMEMLNGVLEAWSILSPTPKGGDDEVDN